MKQIGIIGLGLLAGILLATLSGCDAFDASNQEFASAVNPAKSDGDMPGDVSKAYNEAELSSVTVYDADGNAYVATYNSTESGFERYEAGKTTFAYDLQIGSLSGFHFALQVPECAYQYFDASVPTGNWNRNANGSLEFGPEDFTTGSETIYVTFNGDIPLGVIFASFKYGGAGDTPEMEPILGPCQLADYWITGTVFLDDPAAGRLGFQDANEPGIGGVEVSLFEWDGTANQGEPTQLTAADGSFAFHVLGPPVFNANYRVEILSAGAGLNAKLLDPNGFWRVSDTLFREVDLTAPSSTAPIGFWLDVDRAVKIFEDPTLSETDMLPREFWRVQVTGKGTKRYKPVVPPNVLNGYLASIALFSEHVPYVFPEGISVETASKILQTDSRNDAQEELRTLAMAALLNFAAGRGACATLATEDPPATDYIGFPVCVEPDPESTRLIVEQALVEWMRIEGLTLGKESGGSMSRVLDAMM